jgi:hypothetical protein
LSVENLSRESIDAIFEEKFSKTTDATTIAKAATNIWSVVAPFADRWNAE